MSKLHTYKFIPQLYNCFVDIYKGDKKYLTSKFAEDAKYKNFGLDCQHEPDRNVDYGELWKLRYGVNPFTLANWSPEMFS